MRRSVSPVATIRARDARSSSLVRADLVEGGLQRGVELDVVQRQADLAGQLGEHAVVLLGEGVTVGRALDDDEAEQLAGVGHRRDPQLRRGPALQQRGQPHRTQA